MDESDGDILHLLDRVPVSLRLLKLICSAVVASCLCGNTTAVSGYAVDLCMVLGFISIVFDLIVIGGAARRHHLGEFPTRKTMAFELALDITLSTLWLAALIPLTVKWALSDYLIPGDSAIGWIRSNFQTAVAFAFFAFLFQAALTFFSLVTACACLDSASAPSIFDAEDARADTVRGNETIQNRLTFSTFYLKLNNFRNAESHMQPSVETSNYRSIGE